MSATTTTAAIMVLPRPVPVLLCRLISLWEQIIGRLLQDLCSVRRDCRARFFFFFFCVPIVARKKPLKEASRLEMRTRVPLSEVE